MVNERLIMVPPGVIDIADRLQTETHPNTRWQYQQRLEAARDYINEVLNQIKMNVSKKR